jgi:hydroxymethylglutaryl-CoA lyase
MKLLITESPRDAFQGLHDYIPAQTKIDYINCLLKVGFDIIDIGSFVSEKAIPQMKDTAEVIQNIDLSNTQSKLMVLIANRKGIEKAMDYEQIQWLAFPFSISETFLKLNINADVEKSNQLIVYANDQCIKNSKKLKVYLTMAFGNPYHDTFNTDIVIDAVAKLNSMGIRYITLSDTIGLSDKEIITKLYTQIIKEFPDIEFGFHLHSQPNTCLEKLGAAYNSGCRSFDTVMNAMGGCPMTGFELVSNLNTMDLNDFFNKKQIKTNINSSALNEALAMNLKLFGKNSAISFKF